jgi:hypothetical protein
MLVPLLIAVGWPAIVVVVLAACRAAAFGDRVHVRGAEASAQETASGVRAGNRAPQGRSHARSLQASAR